MHHHVADLEISQFQKNPSWHAVLHQSSRGSFEAAVKMAEEGVLRRPTIVEGLFKGLQSQSKVASKSR
jgi:hypothetical protein